MPCSIALGPSQPGFARAYVCGNILIEGDLLTALTAQSVRIGVNKGLAVRP
jgi:hypothetical protein